MPTISVSQPDLEHLLARSFSLEELERWLPLAKGELKDYQVETGELRIELQDGNRPDLWCTEGIARQIRINQQRVPASYAFFGLSRRPKRRLAVHPGMEGVRPYVAACAAIGYEVTEAGLAQLIQTQEKLADIFGRKRRTVSIGLYRLPLIQFPVTYGLMKPEEARFVPLGFEEKMTLADILAVHPKGLEFGSILSGFERVPLLWDKEGQVLSFPPIINSRDIGSVQPGDKDLFVEVTGTNLKMVLLTLNIFAANLADRGATIEPVEVIYPIATEFGKTLRTPLDFSRTYRLPIKSIETALGEPLGAEHVRKALLAYGYRAKTFRHTLSVTLPPYRNDVMHPVDIVEDVAISRGYETFTPVMPSQFTVGSLSAEEQTSDRIRDLMIGMGFQEVVSNIMSSSQDLIDRMRLTSHEGDGVIEVDNVMSQSYSCLRPWILPSLLRVEAVSHRAFYPHYLFEVGEVASPDPTDTLGCRTSTMLGALIAHTTAHFSETHSFLDHLLFHLDIPYTLEPLRHPTFLDGRAGQIRCEDVALGIIGEIHPEVLEAWQITMPSVAFELNVTRLTERFQKDAEGSPGGL